MILNHQSVSYTHLDVYKRQELYGNGDQAGIDQLEQELLSQNKKHKDWECTEELMKTTKDGKALYMHCLPADITGVSCEEGEVEASVFDRYRVELLSLIHISIWAECQAAAKKYLSCLLYTSRCV